MESVIEQILKIGYDKVKNYLLDNKVNEAAAINEFLTDLIREINPQEEKETIQIEKDRNSEFNIGDYITFDNPVSKYIESSSDIRKLNTLCKVIGYNKPNNIKVLIIKDRNRQSDGISNINLLTEYPYITKLHIADKYKPGLY